MYGANKAADAQTAAADKASAVAQQQYQQTREDLNPYRYIGNYAANELTGKLSDLTTPISVNPDDFLNSEMYKFQSQQGQKAVTNSSAARGLGSSGAALKGAAAFANGLAAQNWQQNFNNQVTNQTNTYNRLKGLVDTGQNASVQTGSAGQNAANTSANAAIGAGNAQAAGANATGGAISNLANNLGGYAMYKGMYGGSGSELPNWGTSSFMGPVR
jgi:hypothetical protein